MVDAAIASFNEDVRTRSDIKKSARNKKNGSATQKLGNRRMSWQEIAEKHGPVSEWCLKDFIDWETFMTMPNDLKVEYVNRLCDEYDISPKHVSQYLFNKGGDGLRAHLSNVLDDNLKKSFYRYHSSKSRAKTGLNQFKDDIKEWKRRVDMAAAIDIYEEEARMEEIPEFMTYEQFKALPPEGVVSFTNGLIDYYGIGYSVIGEYLFKVKSSSMLSIFRSRKVDRLIHKREAHSGGGGDARKYAARFKEDVDKWRAGMKQKSEHEEEEVMEVKTFAAEAEPDVQTIWGAGQKEEYTFTTPSSNNMPSRVPLAISKFKEVVDIPEEIETVEEVPTLTSEIHLHPDQGVTDLAKTDISNDMVEEVSSDKKEDGSLYHDSSFTSDYISIGLDHDELTALELLFKNKKIRVSIRITELE